MGLEIKPKPHHDHPVIKGPVIEVMVTFNGVSVVREFYRGRRKRQDNFGNPLPESPVFYEFHLVGQPEISDSQMYMRLSLKRGYKTLMKKALNDAQAFMEKEGYV